MAARQLFADAERQQAVADALMQRTMQTRGPQQTGRITPTMHWGEGLAQLGEALVARRAGKKAGSLREQAEEARRQEQARALGGMSNPPNLVETQARQSPYARSQEALEAGVDPNVVGAYMGQQLPSGGGQTNAVKDYEYAKRNGFEGSFQDWITAGGQISRPSSVQEWEFYSALPEDQKLLYLEMKRNPNMSVNQVAGAPVVTDPSRIGGVNTTPLSTPEQENEAARNRKAAEATGTAEGGIQGGILTKASSAKTVTDMLDMAEPLIDAATGSLAGAGRDAFMAVFGEAPDGAQAIASLKVLQAGLMTNMPRMEGPQSDRDVQLYREAAGQIGDPTVPAPIKKAALQTIRQLQQKYIDHANPPEEPGASPSPAVTGPVPLDDLLKKYAG